MRPPELTGIWQDIPYWASRWSNSYAFFPDGRYTYRTNEMDCARREMSVSGQWVVRGQKLELTATEKIVSFPRFSGHSVKLFVAFHTPLD
jgi:hypothetical protein